MPDTDGYQEIRVAVAIVVDSKGKVLVNKRPEGSYYGGWWEWPGGKLHVGESPEACALRELKEEIGIDAEIIDCVDQRIAKYPGRVVELYFYLCRPLGDINPSPTALEHCWVQADEIRHLKFLGQNLPVLDALEQGYEQLLHPKRRYVDVHSMDKNDAWSALTSSDEEARGYAMIHLGFYADDWPKLLSHCIDVLADNSSSSFERGCALYGIGHSGRRHETTDVTMVVPILGDAATDADDHVRSVARNMISDLELAVPGFRDALSRYRQSLGS